MPWVGSDQKYHSPLKSSHRAYFGQGHAGMLLCPVFKVSSKSDWRECLATSGVATCVALTFYNSDTNSCLIAHFDSDNDKNAEAVTEALIAGFRVRMIDEAFVFHTAPLENRNGTRTSTGLIVDGIKSALDSSMNVALTAGEIIAGSGGKTDIYICSRNGNVGYYDETWKSSAAVVQSFPVFAKATDVSRTWDCDLSSGQILVYKLKVPLGVNYADMTPW